MFKKLQQYIYRKLAAKTFDSDNELYLYLVLTVATVFSLTVHVCLLVIFVLFQSSRLSIPNFLSIFVYVICFQLIKKKYYNWAGLILSVEVMIYTVLSIYMIGVGNNIVFYLFVVLIMQFIIPYADIRVRGVVIFALWICMLVIIYLSEYGTPIEDVGSISLLLNAFNIHVGFVGAVVELLIGNVIRSFIEHYNNKRMEELESQAYTDSLTGLYNRRYGSIFFSKIGEYSAPYGWYVGSLDIDNFKKINDKYGHDSGDKVLITLAKLMRNNLRKTDILFRWGGEEFLLFLEDVNKEEAYNLLDKLRTIIAEAEVKVNGYSIRFTVTIGAERVDINNVPASIKGSDQKLYIGKNSGKNVVIM